MTDFFDAFSGVAIAGAVGYLVWLCVRKHR